MSTLTETSALIIFAREPKLGKVKTRLAKDIPSKDVLTLYQAFVRDIIELGRSVRCQSKYLFYHGHSAHIPFLRKYAREFDLRKQYGADLGERMRRSLGFAFKAGATKAVIIGTDCLTLDKKLLEEAFEKLEQNDYVLGPAKDGGYYLIGTRCRDASVFQKIPWSTHRVLQKTLKRINSLKGTLAVLPEHEDLDDYPALKRFVRFRREKPLPRFTHQALKKCDLLGDI